MENSESEIPKDQDTKFQGRYAEISKNPLVLVVIGFILTVICGGLFTKWLDSLSSARDLNFSLRTRAADSLRDVTNVLYERRVRGELLASAIHRDAGEQEIKARKKEYDDVFVKYNTILQGDVFRIGEIIDEKFDIRANFFANQIYQIESVSNFFHVIDRCLTASYDSYIKMNAADTAINILSKCDTKNEDYPSIDNLNKSLQDCISSYNNMLYSVVIHDNKHWKWLWPLSIFTESTQQEIQDIIDVGTMDIRKACTLP